MSKTVNLNLDAMEGLGSQVDDILDAFRALGIQVEEDPVCVGSDHFGWNLTTPDPAESQEGKSLDELAGEGQVESLPTEPEDGPDTFTVAQDADPSEVVEAFGRRLHNMGIRVQAHYGEDDADVVVTWDKADDTDTAAHAGGVSIYDKPAS